MKKSLLALAVASLAASSVASATVIYDKDGTSMDVFGRVQSVFYNSNMGNASGDYKDNSALTSGRLGFNFRSDIGYGVAAIGSMEWDVSDGVTEHFATRYIWAGLDFGNAGTLKIGRLDDGIKYVNDITDIFEDQGANAVISPEKRDATIAYSLNNSGFELNVTYQLPANGQNIGNSGSQIVFPDQTKPNEWKEVDNGNVDLESGFGISAGYTTPTIGFGPIAFKAGYSTAESQHKDTAAGEVGGYGNFKDYDQYAIGVSWGTLGEGPYLGTLYNERKINYTTDNRGETKLTGYEFVAGYGFTNGLQVIAGYNHAEEEDGDSKSKSIRVPLIAIYTFNPNFNVWAETSFDGGSDEGEDKGNMFSAGLRYSF